MRFYSALFMWIVLLMVQKSGDHQLRLVVYPILCKVSNIPRHVVSRISSINSVLPFTTTTNHQG